MIDRLEMTPARELVHLLTAAVLEEKNHISDPARYPPPTVRISMGDCEELQRELSLVDDEVLRGSIRFLMNVVEHRDFQLKIRKISNILDSSSGPSPQLTDIERQEFIMKARRIGDFLEGKLSPELFLASCSDDDALE